MKKTLAVLMVTASLAMPGAALADVPEPHMPPTMAPPLPPAPTKTPVDEAKVAISREKAVSIARASFAIPDALGEPDVSLEQSAEGAVWHIQFDRGSTGKTPHNITADVDAETGAVLNYTRWAEESTPERATARLTRKEAAEKAQHWLDLLAPALRPALRAVDGPTGDYYGPGRQTYAFAWDRIVEGYPTRDDGIRITIDAGTGELWEFHRGRWQPGPFVLPPAVLTKEQAEAAYRQQLSMQLSYQYFVTPGTMAGEWRLVYNPAQGIYPLLGQDGKLLNWDGLPIAVNGAQVPRLVPAPDKPYKAPDKPLTREEALALARAVSGQTGEPGSANFQESRGEEKLGVWAFGWISEREHVTVQVDVDRGIVRSYDYWTPPAPAGEERPKVTAAQARDAAVQFMRAARPDLAGNLTVMARDDEGYVSQGPDDKVRPQYYIHFGIMKNGIPVIGRSIDLVVDGVYGRVRNVWSNELTGSEAFPVARPGITPAEAMDAYLKQQGLEPAWYQLWVPDNSEPTRVAPRLLWGPSKFAMPAAIDAQTGALLDYNGRDLMDAMTRPVDIDGYFAEREIELLWSRGIVAVKAGKFNPNGAATVGDVARWLVMARVPYAPYDARSSADKPADPYVGAALQAGIILPEELGAEGKGDGPVSREVLALWTARAMGYGAVAEMADRIELPFADKAAVGARYANAVGLLHGLGIVKGTNFEPQRAATRGEAAAFVYGVVGSEFRR